MFRQVWIVADRVSLCASQYISEILHLFLSIGFVAFPTFVAKTLNGPMNCEISRLAINSTQCFFCTTIRGSLGQLMYPDARTSGNE